MGADMFYSDGSTTRSGGLGLRTGAIWWRWILAFIPPSAAFLVDWAFYDAIAPNIWFIFYPALFVSARLGGLVPTLAATVATMAATWWTLVPPRFSLLGHGREVVAAAMLVVTSCIMASLLEQLRRSHDSLASSHAQRELFSALVENSSDFIGISDLQGRPIYINPGGRSMVGLHPDEPVERTRIRDYFPDDLLGFVKDVIVKEMTARGEWKGETRFRHFRTGEPILVSDKHFVIRERTTGRALGFGTITRDISDLQRARDEVLAANIRLQALERSLRVTVEDLQRAQSVAKVGSWRLLAGDAYQVSEEGHRILGTPLGEPVRYEVFLSLVHPGDRALVDERWRAAVAGNQPYDLEFRLLVDGRVKWVRSAADLHLDAAGVLVGSIGIMQDITDRKRMEDELHRWQQRMEVALDGANLGAWDWNVQTGEFVYNRRWAELRGYDVGELPQRIESWYFGIHPEDLPHVQQALAEHFEGRRPEYAVELRTMTKDGRWVWTLQRGKIVAHDEHGTPLRMAGTSLDISRLKRTELEQRFLADLGLHLGKSLAVEDTLAAIADVAAKHLADWCVIDVVEDSGEVRRAHIGCARPSMRLFADEYARLPLDRTRPLMVTQVLETGTPLLEARVTPAILEHWAQNEEHLRLLRAANICSILWVPLRGRDRILGAVGLVSSTPSHRYGPADLHLAKELTRRASLAVENARLYRASGRAIAARDELLAVVAHDLRNPLGTILMDAQRAQRRLVDLDGSARPVFDRIARAAKRMDRIIQDLLQVTRLEAGGLNLARAALAARAVASEAVEAQQTLAAAASVELRLDAADPIPDVLADRHRLLQVFENLIGNALKFTPAGGRVTVGATRQRDAALYYVRDSGPGISRRGPAAPLRSLLAGTSEPGQQARRLGPGPAHREGHRRGPRRPRVGGERTGRREHLLLHHPSRVLDGSAGVAGAARGPLTVTSQSVLVFLIRRGRRRRIRRVRAERGPHERGHVEQVAGVCPRSRSFASSVLGFAARRLVKGISSPNPVSQGQARVVAGGPPQAGATPRSRPVREAAVFARRPARRARPDADTRAARRRRAWRSRRASRTEPRPRCRAASGSRSDSCGR